MEIKFEVFNLNLDVVTKRRSINQEMGIALIKSWSQFTGIYANETRILQNASYPNSKHEIGATKGLKDVEWYSNTHTYCIMNKNMDNKFTSLQL